MTGTTDDRLPAEPIVERVEKPDGRYVLYFSWSAEDPPNGSRDRDLRERDPREVVPREGPARE